MRRYVGLGVLMVLGLAGFFPRLDPPAGATWTRAAGGAIISPDVAWEQTAVFEPSVLLDAILGWRIWYDGGWANPGVGYASCPAGADPTDPANWTKYAGNPIYGQGGSGYANGAASTEVFLVGSTLYMITSGSPTPSTSLRSTFRVATSSDGLAWTTQASSISLPSGKTLWGNRTVWKEGSTWYMLQEAGPSAWEIYLYTSADLLAWSIANSGNPLTTLELTAGGGGGPTFAQQAGGVVPKQGSDYVLYYHAVPGADPTKSNIYRATSPDKIAWTISPAGAVLTHTGSGFEVDQVGDPVVIVAGSIAYLFYDGIDNPHAAGKIGVATAPATP